MELDGESLTSSSDGTVISHAVPSNFLLLASSASRCSASSFAASLASAALPVLLTAALDGRGSVIGSGSAGRIINSEFE